MKLTGNMIDFTGEGRMGPFRCLTNCTLNFKNFRSTTNSIPIFATIFDMIIVNGEKKMVNQCE